MWVRVCVVRVCVSVGTCVCVCGESVCKCGYVCVC